jgi:hypothetical protein
LILNHIAAEALEYGLHRPSLGTKSSISRFLSNLEFKWIPIFEEYTFGILLRRLVSFGVCNSMEIGEYQRRMALGSYNVFLIPDGVNTAELPLTNAPNFKEELCLFFLKGANTFATYNGLDRVLDGMKMYKGDIKITLEIFGNELEYEKKLIEDFGLESTVKLRSYLSSKQLTEVLDRFHMGVGSFGVHRKGVQSNSSIKSREYFARGIPFIYGHMDPDFSEDEIAKKYCLEFPGDDSPVDFEKAIAFLVEVRKDKGFGEKMRQFAASKLDYKVKMAGLKQIIERKSLNLKNPN